MVDSDTGTLVRHCDTVMSQGCHIGPDTSHNNNYTIIQTNTASESRHDKNAGTII